MPRTVPRVICVPDTNALVHLRYVNVAGRSACLWLWDEFEVRVGNRIPREIQDIAGNNPELAPSQIRRKLGRSVVELDYALAQMERCFLDPLDTQFDADEDMGERINSQLALQLMARNSARHIIFLTDELRIMRPNIGFVWKVFNTYPIGLVWNSLDFLLYLFFRQTRFLYPQAEDAIRDVNTRIGGNTEAHMARLTDYTRRLNTINVARQRLPTLWVPART